MWRSARLIALTIFGLLMFAIVILWSRVQSLEKRIAFLQHRVERGEQVHREAIEQQDKENSMTADYVERVHRGLIKSGGHVEDPSVQRVEWQSLDYIQEINKWHDGLKLRKRWRKMELIQGERGEQLPGAGIVNIDRPWRAWVEWGNSCHHLGRRPDRASSSGVC